jgi:hypothetical protein
MNWRGPLGKHGYAMPILDGAPSWKALRATSRWEFGASQLIKAWKRRDAALALRMLRRAGDSKP